MRLNLWIIKGEEKTTKQEMQIMYFGRDFSRYYVKDLVFNNITEEKCMGKKWIWSTLKIAGKNYTNSSLLIAETGDFLAKILKDKQEFYLPCWIQGEMEIHSNIENPYRRNKSLKNDFRKIFKYNLSYELTNEQAQFNLFYHDMYVPFATKRYREKAKITDYYELKMSFNKGELLMVKMDSIPIAGILIGYKKKQPLLHVLGVKDCNPEYIGFGAIAACYYHSINHLKERGFSSLNLGSTRPFLRDGVLNFKKKLGLKLVGESGSGFLLKPLTKTDAVKAFLLNNPFIIKDKNHLYGVLFISPEQIDYQKFIEKIVHDHDVDGLSKFIFYLFEDNKSPIQISVPSELNNRIKFRNAREVFSPYSACVQ
jgi:hypothetical protein